MEIHTSVCKNVSVCVNIYRCMYGCICTCMSVYGDRCIDA